MKAIVIFFGLFWMDKILKKRFKMADSCYLTGLIPSSTCTRNGTRPAIFHVLCWYHVNSELVEMWSSSLICLLVCFWILTLCAALPDTDLLCIFFSCKDSCGYNQKMLMQKHLTDTVQQFGMLTVLTGSPSRVLLHKFLKLVTTLTTPGGF